MGSKFSEVTVSGMLYALFKYEFIEEPAEKNILETLRKVKNVKKCSCVNPIWVAGSVFTGNMFFKCTTGEFDATEDYEIKKALTLYEANIKNKEK